MKTRPSVILFTIGDKVVKVSGKPFKSKLKWATIKGFTTNPDNPKHPEAATFEEDDSLVSLSQLKMQK
jgi:hypothetical protein